MWFLTFIFNAHFTMACVFVRKFKFQGLTSKFLSEFISVIFRAYRSVKWLFMPPQCVVPSSRDQHRTHQSSLDLNIEIISK